LYQKRAFKYKFLKKIIAIIFLKYYVSKISALGRGDFGGVRAGMRDRVRLSARRGDRQFFELQLAFKDFDFWPTFYAH
jgi:hypothetical protein